MATQTVPQRDVDHAAISLAPPGFVGRERELAALGEALARPPAVVLVEGEAGIGKSRLVHEVLSTPSAARLRALVGACAPVREGFTLGPVVDAVRQVTASVRDLELSALAGTLRPLFPEWADDLPPAPDPVEDATAARHRLFRAFTELLDALGTDVLVVEDVHWSDDATMEFLLSLASRRAHRLSLVATYRPEDVPAGTLLARLGSGLPAGTTRLRLTLAPLSLPDTARLVSSMVGEPVTEEFARFLHERGDGLPLAVEELVRLLGDRADIVPRAGGWVRRHLGELSVPPTIRDAVLERAGRLAPDTRAVLQAVAVAAEPVGEAILRQVARLGAVRARSALAQALESRLLVESPDGMLTFRHAMARQAIYETIPGTQRRTLHARAGQAIETHTPLPVARLAHHFRKAGDAERWRQYGEQAADLALAASDDAAAGELLCDLVVHAQPSVGDIIRLTSKIELMSLDESDRQHALVYALRSVLESVQTSDREEADLRWQLGRVLVSMGEWNAAHVELERAVPHLHDPVVAARTMTGLGSPIASEMSVAAHLGWLRRAAALEEQVGPVDRGLIRVNRAVALLKLGEEDGWAEAALTPDDPPPGVERTQVAVGSVNIANAAIYWGRYSDARQWLTRSLALAEAGELHLIHNYALVVAAHLDYLTGAWHGLAERAAQLADDRSIGALTLRPRTSLVTALLEAAAGAGDQAEQRLALVLEDERRRDVADYLEPAAALARLFLSQGRLEDALRVTDEPIRIVSNKGTWVWASDIAPTRVETLLTAGRNDEAAALTRRLARGMRGRNASAPRAALLLCRAMLAQAGKEYSRAAVLFGRAAGSWQGLPRPYDALLSRERQARCLVLAGHEDEALALLGEVLDGLSRLGAAGDADRVADLLRQHGRVLPRVWRGGRRGYGDQLSPRELDVVRLVAAGHTNREVAGALHRSVRTIEGQLNSAMRKLGVSSRAALAARAVETGLTGSSANR